MFGVTDLFVVGIGFDIVGACLVSKGLLVRPEELLLRSGTFVGHNFYEVKGLIADRVRGEVGLALLVFGFALQAAAYALTVTVGRPSQGTLLGVVIAASASLLLAIGLYWSIRKARLRRVIIGLAYYEWEHPHEKRALPSARTISSLAQWFGWKKPDDQTDQEFARTAFRVKNTRE